MLQTIIKGSLQTRWCYWFLLEWAGFYAKMVRKVRKLNSVLVLSHSA